MIYRCTLRSILCCLLLLVSACQRKVEDSASVTIKFPSSQSLQKVGALSAVDATKICYVANVMGSGIAEQAKTCDIKRGILAGSVAPGAELSVTVPTGSNRTVEIYGVLRNSASEPCPSVQNGWPVPLTRVYFLGHASNIEVRPPTTTVDISIALPDTSQNILAQYSMPATCNISSASTKGGRIFGYSYASPSVPGSYKKTSRISYKTEDQLRTSTGGYKVKNSAIVGM